MILDQTAFTPIHDRHAPDGPPMRVYGTPSGCWIAAPDRQTADAVAAVRGEICAVEVPMTQMDEQDQVVVDADRIIASLGLTR